MSSGQAEFLGSGATTGDDEELLQFLVPPRQSRWKTALYVALLGVALAAIVFVATSGLVVPRMEITSNTWQRTGKTRVVTFEVKNKGHFSSKLEAFDASSKGLTNSHAFLPAARTIAPGHTMSVRVTVTIADCNTAANSQASTVRLRMTDAFGVAVTHAYNVDLLTHWVAAVTNDCQNTP